MEYMKKLNEFRTKLGISQKDLGDKVGVSEASISNYETGKREPSLATLCALADLFNCSLDLLVRGKEKDRPEGRSTESMLTLYKEMSEERLYLLQAVIQTALADKRLRAQMDRESQEEL